MVASDAVRKRNRVFWGRVLPSRLYLSICVLLTIFIVAYSSFGHFLLPEKYLRDQLILMQYMGGASDCDFISRRNSFACTAKIYDVFFIDANSGPVLAGLTVALLFLYVPRLRGGKITLNRQWVRTFGLAVLWAFAAATFNAGFNKELLAFIFILASAISLAHDRRVLSLLILVAYGLLVRSYWLLLVGVAIATYIAARRMPPFMACVTCLLCVIAIVAAYYLVFGVPIGALRESINDSRSNDVATMISPFISETSLYASVADTLLIWASLIVPWKLFFSGSPLHFLAGGLVSLTMVASWRAFLRCAATQSRQGLLAAVLIIAFTGVQSLFEPDYGSFVRHMSEFAPFLLLAEGLPKRVIATMPKKDVGGQSA